MSLTFSITPNGVALPVEYAAISLTNGRQALDFDAGAAHQQVFRFHQPGVEGQWIIRGGSVGRAIQVSVRYMDASKDAAEALYKTDRDNWVTKQCTIVALGQTYNGCNVVPESIRRSAPIRGTGRTAGQVFFNVAATFTQDNPAGT